MSQKNKQNVRDPKYYDKITSTNKRLCATAKL